MRKGGDITLGHNEPKYGDLIVAKVKKITVFFNIDPLFLFIYFFFHLYFSNVNFTFKFQFYS